MSSSVSYLSLGKAMRLSSVIVPERTSLLDPRRAVLFQTHS